MISIYFVTQTLRLQQSLIAFCFLKFPFRFTCDPWDTDCFVKTGLSNLFCNLCSVFFIHCDSETAVRSHSVKFRRGIPTGRFHNVGAIDKRTTQRVFNRKITRWGLKSDGTSGHAQLRSRQRQEDVSRNVKYGLRYSRELTLGRDVCIYIFLFFGFLECNTVAAQLKQFIIVTSQQPRNTNERINNFRHENNKKNSISCHTRYASSRDSRLGPFFLLFFFRRTHATIRHESKATLSDKKKNTGI